MPLKLILQAALSYFIVSGGGALSIELLLCSAYALTSRSFSLTHNQGGKDKLASSRGKDPQSVTIHILYLQSKFTKFDLI